MDHIWAFPPPATLGNKMGTRLWSGVQDTYTKVPLPKATWSESVGYRVGSTALKLVRSHVWKDLFHLMSESPSTEQRYYYRPLFLADMISHKGVKVRA